ncbi:MAG: hypothetical protein ACYDD1_16055 [Caulobacteraceae bacterium]
MAIAGRADASISTTGVTPSTHERAYALARSGVCGCIADLKDRLIREGHGALEVLGLLSASSVAKELGQVMARSGAQVRRQHD